MKSVVYTPKSKFHIDFGWQFAFTEALDCPRKRDLLQQVLYFSQKDDSTFINAIGEQYQGMLINYESLAKKLGVSRRTLQTLLNQLANDGYLVKFKLNNNRILAQATDKAFNLLDSVHEASLAAKTDVKDYEQLSTNFEIVRNFETQLQARQILHSSDGKLGKNCQAPLNRNKVNREKTINNNQYQVLETETQFENSDCLTVVFYFDEFGLGEIAAESDLFDYFTSAQSQILSTIVYCYATCLDIRVFNETLARKDLRQEVRSFRQLVDWAYAAAMGDQEKVSTKIKIASNNLTKVTINAKKRKPVPNSNTVDLMEAFQVCGTDHQGVSDEASTTQTDSNSSNEVGYNTAQRDHDIKSALQQSLPSNVNTGNVDLDMPVVEKEVLRKDWISLADQNFYEGVLPDSQKIALVAIIDYVKRKGVVIGSDTEIYKWLYHTASNHQHYYSRAMNFKHLANILIKQLMNRRFERPSGFNAWEQRIQQQIGCSSMLQKE